MVSKDWEYDRSVEVGLGGTVQGKTLIAESWARCRDFGLQASGAPRELVLSESSFKGVLEKDGHVRRFVLPELELLYNQIAGTNFMVAYANAEGIVLDALQDQDFKAGEGGKAVVPGSVWMEQQRGTNALGLAIHTRRPSIVTGADHFFHTLNDLSCFAVPIFDHADELLGIIDATSNAQSRNEHTLALVKLAARNIENRIFTERFSQSLVLMFHARQEYLPTTSVAMIAVDEYGFIEGANSNAKLVLSGLDIGRRQHFDAVFDSQFYDAMDRIRAQDTIQIRDRLGSVVFMKGVSTLYPGLLSLQGKALSAPNLNGARHEDQRQPSSFFRARAESENRAELVFDDEALLKSLAGAVTAIQLGIPLTVLGEESTGKTELAKEINRLAFGDVPLLVVDCRYLSDETFDEQMFGDNGRFAFFDLEKPINRSGKLFLARGGVMLFKNAHKLEQGAQQTLAAVLRFEDNHRQDAHHTTILGWIFTAPLDWLDGKSNGLSTEFTNAIYGKTIVAPSLNQRTDFEKLAVAVTAACSSQHTLSRESLRRLKAQRWEGNFLQLKKVIRLAIANASGTVIREELDQSLETLTPGEGFQPCPLCEGSPVRAEMCVMIQRAWSEANGNVSMVARRLGISRNTVYKHIKGL